MRASFFHFSGAHSPLPLNFTELIRFAGKKKREGGRSNDKTFIFYGDGAFEKMSFETFFYRDVKALAGVMIIFGKKFFFSKMVFLIL